MTRRVRRAAARVAFVCAAALLTAGCDDDPTGPTALEGRRVYGVDARNNLVLFGSASVGTARSRAITGLQAGERVLGIDFRPVDGKLYALGGSSRVYVVDTATAAATVVGGAAFTPALAGTVFGWDFNPVPDRIRSHGALGQNLRLNPATGAVAATDGALVYAAGDAGTGTPRIAATAYTNSVAGATTTTLFAIDAARDVLVTLPSPNDGQVRTVGALGVDAGDDAGLDVFPNDGVAYAALTVGGRTSLYTVNLTTGAATRVGDVRGTGALRGIAVAP